MSAYGLRLRTSIAAFAVPLAFLTAGPASAQEAESSTRDAAKHFQRGVALYGEADYRAALVEFKRAYALAPNAAVLYNVGETEYQLQDYAGALTTFRRYLAESGPNESHRAEVENNVEVLRARVGHVSITTSPPGADITIDDQPIGKTPLDEPALVSIGHRKVAASMAGRPTVTRYVDVAADDNVSLTLQLPGPSEPAQAAARPLPATPTDTSVGSHSAGPTLRVAGWITTGVLTAGAVTFGVLANKEASDLKAARNSFPTTSATLNHDSSLTSTYSIVADSLTAAAVVVGGITLISTLTSSSSSAPARGSAGGTRVMLGPASASLETTF
ncbi:MAG TPA: PEGA domain-containing protein [Polyangiaceae bacterium]|nr:PEGA domain-containing protein [Polyangiaceae bacterium]